MKLDLEDAADAIDDAHNLAEAAFMAAQYLEPVECGQ